MSFQGITKIPIIRDARNCFSTNCEKEDSKKQSDGKSSSPPNAENEGKKPKTKLMANFKIETDLCYEPSYQTKNYLMLSRKISMQISERLKNDLTMYFDIALREYDKDENGEHVMELCSVEILSVKHYEKKITGHPHKIPLVMCWFHVIWEQYVPDNTLEKDLEFPPDLLKTIKQYSIAECRNEQLEGLIMEIKNSSDEKSDEELEELFKKIKETLKTKKKMGSSPDQGGSISRNSSFRSKTRPSVDYDRSDDNRGDMILTTTKREKDQDDSFPNDDYSEISLLQELMLKKSKEKNKDKEEKGVLIQRVYKPEGDTERPLFQREISFQEADDIEKDIQKTDRSPITEIIKIERVSAVEFSTIVSSWTCGKLLLLYSFSLLLEIFTAQTLAADQITFKTNETMSINFDWKDWGGQKKEKYTLDSYIIDEKEWFSYSIDVYTFIFKFLLAVCSICVYRMYLYV